MSASDSFANIAIIAWAITWLPGMFLLAYRATALIRVRKTKRAFVEALLIGAIPAVTYGGYLISDAALQRQASREVSSLGLAASVAQVSGPYMVCLLCAWWLNRKAAPDATSRAWWLVALAGLVSVPLLTPGLFMTQLMVVFGG